MSVDDFRHVALDEVGSTNTECLARARAGDPGHLWITAGRQTDGRGRRGRAWRSERGNLYASLLVIDPAPLEMIPSLPLAVAVAVRDAMQAVLPAGARTADIKWPNDILIGGKKTCGILLEGERLPDGRYALVIGCGINVATAPDHGLYPLTDLRSEGSAASAEDVFAHLFMSMADTLGIWDAGRGIGDIIALWRRYAVGIGRPITVNLPDRSITGIFDDIDGSGQLILTDEHGMRRHIAAGDVFFG
ncbi:biotin biosynthesis protein [Rhizobium sp. Leaf384]|uniref:biotin--[acetyl-CoA-carboxylase] ligase n=1 Tax=unclassified Rhizobium TaxID=2613769 RepID=UPI00071235CD|nr:MULTISPECIES: biotin--[acetyl-CoA-carboxylase] ligase [unclassified Rhizobium]KQS74133.1 biotin biosynthesis protein [Rhizobium sp. Leaf383]KQS80328.1 biotin biosynthesis protein [Rhizobium sp. Leaf384]